MSTTTKQGAILINIGVFILATIVLALIGYFIYVKLLRADCSLCTFVPECPKDRILWLRFSSEGDVKNTTYESTKLFCLQNNAVIATREDLEIANKRGFEYCASGWFTDTDDKPAVGRMMQNPGDTNCSGGVYETGLDVVYPPHPRVYTGAFCVGEKVPVKKEIVKSIELD